MSITTFQRLKNKRKYLTINDKNSAYEYMKYKAKENQYNQQ